MAVHGIRPLPGFRFEDRAHAPTEVLSRLDVACFVGIAARGPLHQPVRVDSINLFEMIFGDDAPLAWDEARGEMVNASLAPAVRAFFRNGGQLAWVIRVASDAHTSEFPLPGLVQIAFDEDGDTEEIHPAFALARSPGSWADQILVSTSLLSQGIPLSVIALNPPCFSLASSASRQLVAGDLLRIIFDGGYILYTFVSEIKPYTNLSPPDSHEFLVECDQASWFMPSWVHMPQSAVGKAYLFTSETASRTVDALVPIRGESPILLEWPTLDNQAPVRLDLNLDIKAAPQPGSMLRVDLGADQLWMRVEDVGVVGDSASSPFYASVRVTGQGWWWVKIPTNEPTSIDVAERLSFELWAREGEAPPLRMSNLAFHSRHTRYWDALPDDLQLYSANSVPPRMDRAGLWQEAASPRYPLAGKGHSHVLFVPLAVPPVPDFHLRSALDSADTLTRDGLSEFDSRLFLDQKLVGAGVSNLIGEADTLRYRSINPHKLTGIHAALEVEEATLIVVPDAVQRGWNYWRAEPPCAPPHSDPPLRPEWWRFMGCDPERKIKPADEPEWGNFLNCDTRIIIPPILWYTEPDRFGTFRLQWTQPEPGLIYRLQEATRPDFVGSVDVYTGLDDEYTFYGHISGIFYYRVIASVEEQTSNWSNGLAVRIGKSNRWRLNAVEDYTNGTLLEIQHAVLRLCAARGDLFAVLGLPEHYREDDAIEHIQTLTTGSSGFFGPEEPRTLSFGAIYHPWLIGREENRPEELRRIPPDGAMAGIFARRTLHRGAWQSPANETLKGVVALHPAIVRGRWQDLQDAQLNLIRQEPRGFTALNSDTLTGDEELRSINVRRLLILLRRLTQRLGSAYVFEPNNAAFRRSVQRGFEAMLDIMFLRGAFAGATADASYQVVTDATVNPSALIDQGRFVVELRIAPSLPMRFLTIRLVQTGDRTLVMQE